MIVSLKPLKSIARYSERAVALRTIAIERDEEKKYFLPLRNDTALKSDRIMFSEKREENYESRGNSREYLCQYRFQNRVDLRNKKCQYYDQNTDKLLAKQRKYHMENRDELLEKQRQYHSQNRSELLEKQRQYRLQKRDEVTQKDRQYYLQNRLELLKKQRQYRIQNINELRKKHREYRVLNKAKLAENHRRFRFRNHMNPNIFIPRTIPQNSWKTPDLVRTFFSSVADRLRVSSPSDWYRVSHAQIASIGGRSLASKFGNLGGALQFAFPEIEWNLNNFAMMKKKSGQRWVKVKIEELMPGIEIIEDYQHPELSWEKSDNHMELDLWLPQYRIGIEYQGEQHYYNLDNAFGPNATAKLYSERDMMKLSLCQVRDITLIVIPCWWDGEKESLSATLYEARPDVFPKSISRPISTWRESQATDSRLDLLCDVTQ